MPAFNKYSTDGGANFIDVEDRNAVHWADNAILGAKNLLKNTAYSRTINNVVWTVNADGSITANGKATGGNSALYIHGVDGTFINDLPSRELIFSGCPSGGSINSYWMDFRYRIGSSTTNQFLNDTGSGATISWDDTKKYDIVRCFIKDGYTADNVTFYPMIRLASDTDSTYESYTMTNKELTEYIQKRVLSSSDNLNDITDTGIYGATSAPTNSPAGETYYTLIVQKTASSDIRQIIMRHTGIYIRYYGGSPAHWSGWYKVTLTAI